MFLQYNGIITKNVWLISRFLLARILDFKTLISFDQTKLFITLFFWHNFSCKILFSFIFSLPKVNRLACPIIYKKKVLIKCNLLHYLTIRMSLRIDFKGFPSKETAFNPSIVPITYGSLRQKIISNWGVSSTYR